MIGQIKTSTENKERVTRLTRKFGLGAENIIARIAIAYSLKQGGHFDPTKVKDSGGKEYSRNVLFGNLFPLYLSMICEHYQIKSTDKDLPRYFKLHLDDGLELIDKDVKDNPNLVGFDYLFDKIHEGLSEI
ncbi:DNA sulfur modification protein DndE [Xylanibacter ruminicola]|jgi:DNA sulfur modification protein DndE|uniref:DNA sulfur modification protein DndE n=1 Tax=Xylanibacter ruminicola TaxID=839 RepID=A0A1H5S144_XYLRU|nr:DndE family protein [Xylanibacter ruminicola]SEF43491.1 DNA sulfur modification protein DndE [Xylanibacter ruminicola]